MRILRLSIFEPDFCFKKVDFLEKKTVHNDFFDVILFNNVTFLEPTFYKLSSKNFPFLYAVFQLFLFPWQYSFNKIPDMF